MITFSQCSVFFSCIVCVIGFNPGAGQRKINVVPASPFAFTFPCKNDPALFTMTYFVQTGNNNWDGVFYMDSFVGVTNVRLQVVLKHAANITVTNLQGDVFTSDHLTFIVTTHKIPPQIKWISFRVAGLASGFFPHLKSLRFGDETLCDNSLRDLSSPFLKKSKVCGKAVLGTTQPMVSNSYKAEVGKWPWHVAIYHRKGDNGKEYKCGGTLINKNTVLTAAHCMLDTDQLGHILLPEKYILHFGKNKLSEMTANVKEVPVRNAILHESFEGSTLNADIGILKLVTDIEFTDYIQPVCLPDGVPQEELESKTGFVVGWGITESGATENLRQASMPTIDPKVCLSSNRAVFGASLSPTNFCAGHRNGTSVCTGDSGSGMFVEVNGLWLIKGIVSHGVNRPSAGGCNSRDYVLFTDVTVFINWIMEKIDERDVVKTTFEEF